MSIGDRASVSLWLFSGCALIFLMVVIGGITRLTGSGLSITKWDVVTGTIPPLSEAEWQKEFDLYRETPQFHQINAHFDLEEFKQIYWWEYIHRLLGRLIGLIFLIPFLYFVLTKKLNRELILKCLLLFAMGGFQGFIGWYMVQSGLVDIPSVSHFRLAVHLVTAFITFGLTFWFAFDLIHTRKLEMNFVQKSSYRLTWILWTVTLIQIIFGAFVAGLKAGLIYNTWPLMGDSIVPDSVLFGWNNMGWASLVNTLPGVQFIHRNLAWLVVGFALILFIYAHRNLRNTTSLSAGQYRAVVWVMIAVIMQFLLGVITLLLKVPVFWGVIHQAGAFLLFALQVYLLHRMVRGPEVIVR
jgi:heme a synthase